MKKVIIFFISMLISTSIFAEEMEFVTTLSSPMGTFARLETVNPTEQVVSSIINFSNQKSVGSRVELKGANVYLNSLYLKSSTTLGGSVPEFRVRQQIQLYSSGSIIGSRLMSNKVDFSSATEASSKVENTLYIDNMTVQGGQAAALTITNQVEFVGANTASKKDLNWNNSYKCDYKATDVGSTEYYGPYEVVQDWMSLGECVRQGLVSTSAPIDTCYVIDETTGETGLDVVNPVTSDVILAAPGESCVDIRVPSRSESPYTHYDVNFTATYSSCVSCFKPGNVGEFMLAYLNYAAGRVDHTEISSNWCGATTPCPDEECDAQLYPGPRDFTRLVKKIEARDGQYWLILGCNGSDGLTANRNWDFLFPAECRVLKRKEEGEGTAECITDNKYTSYLLKGE